jgi:hypothetical protein
MTLPADGTVRLYRTWGTGKVSPEKRTDRVDEFVKEVQERGHMDFWKRAEEAVRTTLRPLTGWQAGGEVPHNT